MIGQNLTQKLNSMVLRVCLCYINHSHMQHFFNVKLDFSMLTHEYSNKFSGMTGQESIVDRMPLLWTFVSYVLLSEYCCNYL
jgi:hypothetical protein